MTDPIKYEGWAKGMDNRRKEFDLPDGTLRDGLNVDVLNSGKVRMRYGPGTQAFTDSGAHSVFSDGRALYWATANALKRGVIGATQAALLTDSRLAKPLSWFELNGRCFFSNEDVNGLVNPMGAYEPWGIVPPAAAPTLTNLAPAPQNGAPTPPVRIVQVTCVFLAATVALDGSTVLEESGAPPAAAVNTDDSGSISVSNIPQSTDPRYAGTRLYVTALDGEEFYRTIDLPPGVTYWFLSYPYSMGEPLKTMLHSNMPPGQLIEHHNGRAFVAVGNVLYESDPLRPTMYDNDRKFFMFPERITLVKGVPQGESRGEPAGLFISSDQTYFLEGAGTKDVQLRRALDYKAIEGAAIHLLESKEVMWLSERGIVRGSSGGRVENLTEHQIAVDSFTRAAMGFLERDGHRSVMVVGASSTPTPLVATDWTADEAERAASVR